MAREADGADLSFPLQLLEDGSRTVVRDLCAAAHKFSVHNLVTVPAGDGRALEALARYGLRNAVGLARLRWEPGSASATYLPRPGHDDEKAETLDALDFLARFLRPAARLGKLTRSRQIRDKPLRPRPPPCPPR